MRKPGEVFLWGAFVSQIILFIDGENFLHKIEEIISTVTTAHYTPATTDINVRKMMDDDDTLLQGEVEVDEMYMHRNPQKCSTAKAHTSETVFGMVERGGNAKVRHVKSAGVRVLSPEIKESVAQGTTVYRDKARVYDKLDLHGYPHASINHSKS